MKELKELLAFIIGLGNAVGASLEDGKFELSELGLLMLPLTKAPAAFSDMKLIPAELASLTDAQKAELLEYVKTEFDIPEDKVEELIENVLKAGLALYGVVTLFVKPKVA